MSGRSLSCSPEGIQKAKRALIRYSLTQKALADELEVTRQPVGKFFTGKPVDRNLFVQICDRLDLEWEEIVTEPASEPEVNQDKNIDIDALVGEVREKIKPLIQERCGTMRVLDMTQPIGLNDIYTSVNILEKITGQRRLGIDQLLNSCSNQDFERFGLGSIAEEGVPGLHAVKKYPKMIILGKPGAGKTTFLKYLAIQCIGGTFHSHLVPIFVTLKDFAETVNKPSLQQFIIQLVPQVYRLPLINNSQESLLEENTCTTVIENLLSQGRMMILLDGLDEVREEDISRVLTEIRQFSQLFQNNRFVITCRIAAREYIFEKFTEVEIADFDDDQISNFANNWFKAKTVKTKNFIKRLEENNRIKQLASSPLLLTLLCLVFEESGDFPANRSELYKEGLDALLKKWDAKRGIQRDQVYKKLSVQRKEDLLSKIAFITFEQGDYFFKQKTAEMYITEYIRNLPNANTDEEALQVDSERVLKSIEAQHGLLVERAKGIYSFSHLTFHEYCTAREIVIVKQLSEDTLHNLLSHLTETRWREVLLLAVGMSASADRLLLLMKEKIDLILARHKKLQEFLIWLSLQSQSVKVPYKLAAVRAFYFALVLDCEPAITRALASDLNIDYQNILALNLEQAGTRTHLLYLASIRNDIIHLNLADTDNLNRARALTSGLHYNLLLDCVFELNLGQALQHLKEQLPAPDDDEVRFKQWWQANGQSWYEQLRLVIVQYHNIFHNWQFSKHQQEVLDQYYEANLLLVDCLNSDCYVSRQVRQQIEDTLLLPIAEIKQRQQQSGTLI
ncbi:MAG: NACHT C-terminal helical domain 2-containing protein [Nostoc sp. SerVER01]|nr:NACHT domain-containing NTPase [Nostoc sp. SerVER01]